MLIAISGFLSGLAAHWERQRFVNRLQRLDNRMLDDIGLRRDQLDALRLPPRREIAAPPRDASAIVRPSLQGCG